MLTTRNIGSPYKMKKIIIIVIVLVAAAFIGMPYITGKVAQSETEKLVERMNQGNQKYGYSEIVKYERGFRSTQSSFKLLFPLDGDELEVLYSCDGSHGVTSYAYECQIDSFGEYQAFVAEHLQGNDPLSLTGSVSAFGSINQKINIAPIENIEIDGDTMSSEGGFVNFETNRELSEYKVDGDIGASKFSIDGAILNIASGKLNGDIEVADDGVQLGEFGLVASGFIYSINSYTLEVENFQLDTATTGNGQNIEIDYTVKTQNIDIKSEKNFPSIKKAVINLSGEGFDRASIAKLTKLVQEMSEQGDITPQQQAVLIPAAEGLLKKGLGLKLDVDVDFDKDKMTSVFDFKLIDDATITDLSAVLFNPESLLDKLSIESNTFLPDTLLAIDNTLATTVENNPMFNRKGNGFSSELVLKKDNMSLNGEKVTFEELMNSAR